MSSNSGPCWELGEFLQFGIPGPWLVQFRKFFESSSLHTFYDRTSQAFSANVWEKVS